MTLSAHEKFANQSALGRAISVERCIGHKLGCSERVRTVEAVRVDRGRRDRSHCFNRNSFSHRTLSPALPPALHLDLEEAQDREEGGRERANERRMEGRGGSAGRDISKAAAFVY